MDTYMVAIKKCSPALLNCIFYASRGLGAWTCGRVPNGLTYPQKFYLEQV